MFKREDDRLEDLIEYPIPVLHDKAGEMSGLASYPHKEEPSIWEKRRYANLLAPNSKISTTLDITDQDIRALKDKAYRATEAEFNNFVGQLLEPAKNPANKEFLRKIYPEWFEKQKRLIENWHDTKKRVESLLLMGPRNKEDLFLLYRLGYKNGKINPGDRESAGILQPLADQVNGTPPSVGTAKMTEKERMTNFRRGALRLDSKLLTAKPMMYNDKFSVFQAPEGTNYKNEAYRDDYALNDLLSRLSIHGDGYPKPGEKGLVLPSEYSGVMTD